MLTAGHGSWWLAAVVIAACVLASHALAGAAGEGAPGIPAWRGKAPGTAYLGPDVLWRCREGLVFHMHDDNGDGFILSVSVRDMNTYQQGPRPVLLWMTGPRGDTVAHKLLEDDGEENGDFLRCDGISDVFQDFRYREWHRVHSPAGRPPGKERSAYLDAPQSIPGRTVTMVVPPAGAGPDRLL